MGCHGSHDSRGAVAMDWVIAVLVDPLTIEKVLEYVKSLLVDLGVWGNIGTVLTAMLIFTAVSFVWRVLRN